MKIFKTQKQRILWFLALGYLFAAFLDLISTIVALEYRGAKEANPLFAESSYLDLAILKFSVSFITASFLCYTHNRFQDIQNYFILHNFRAFLKTLLRDAKSFKTFFTLRIKTAETNVLAGIYGLIVTGMLMSVTAFISNMLAFWFHFGFIDLLKKTLENILNTVDISLSIGFYFAIIVIATFILWLPVGYILTKRIIGLPNKNVS